MWLVGTRHHERVRRRDGAAAAIGNRQRHAVRSRFGILMRSSRNKACLKRVFHDQPAGGGPIALTDGGRVVGDRASRVRVSEGGDQPFCIGTHHQFGDGQGRIGDGGRGALPAARAHLDGQDKDVNTCF